MLVPSRFLTFTFWTKSISPSSSIWSVRVGSNVCNGWILRGGYIYPSTPSPFVRDPSECAYTSTIHFLREKHLLMCWYQYIPIQPQESWSLGFPSCFPLKSSFHQIQILWERVECWGDYHLKHKSKEFIINTPFITSWRVVSPRLARCHLGASDKIVELNQGVCKGKEIAYFVKIYR